MPEEIQQEIPETEWTEQMMLEQVFLNMKQAFTNLKSDLIKKDRHTALVATKIEEAMMWLNKNRAAKGYFEKKLDTHVE